MLIDERGAWLSDDKKYRYRLWRTVAGATGSRTAVWIMLNPSTADAITDDATVRRCIGFCRSWNYSRLEIVNLYAYRATDPKQLLKVDDPVGPENDEAIRAAVRNADIIVAAWGNNLPEPTRAKEVIGFIKRRGKAGVHELHHLGLTKSGQPKHPVRLAASLTPQPWPEAEPDWMPILERVTPVTPNPNKGVPLLDNRESRPRGRTCHGPWEHFRR